MTFIFSHHKIKCMICKKNSSEKLRFAVFAKTDSCEIKEIKLMQNKKIRRIYPLKIPLFEKAEYLKTHKHLFTPKPA